MPQGFPHAGASVRQRAVPCGDRPTTRPLNPTPTHPTHILPHHVDSQYQQTADANPADEPLRSSTTRRRGPLCQPATGSTLSLPGMRCRARRVLLPRERPSARELPPGTSRCSRPRWHPPWRVGGSPPRRCRPRSALSSSLSLNARLMPCGSLFTSQSSTCRSRLAQGKARAPGEALGTQRRRRLFPLEPPTYHQTHDSDSNGRSHSPRSRCASYGGTRPIV